MDDKTLETLADQFRQIVLNTVAKSSSPTCITGILDPGQAERQTDSVDENHVSDVSNEIKEVSFSSDQDTHEASPDHEQNVPVLKKIYDLSTKVENLRKEQRVLADEVKGLTIGSFPEPEVHDTLRFISNEHELLRKKFLHESSERKRLYNEMIELKGNIRVFCRCRPLSQDDITNGSISVVDFGSCHENELQIICSDSSKKNFKFDHVFKPEDNQESVFAQTSPVVTSVLDGYNVCIFAYGQTGTGKTFTMEGTPENRGVNYRTLEELFRLSKERSGVMKYELLVSMLEVYNEKIRDLLVENQPTKKLEIKQTAEGTQEVPGLVEACVHGIDEVWELLKSGSRARSVGSTNANELSSRSHCLLRVSVKGENIVNGQKTKSHLWLVDLAGSERVGKIEVEGERLKESQFINKSLSALGDVISALASKTSHVPYRNSKLTHMLQSSLGGDCKTLMFVQISPSVTDVGETICSLNFASRVRGIESGPARKQTDLTELFKYKQLTEKQKHDEKEMKKLQESLQSLQLRATVREQACRSLQEKVRDLENQLAEERKLRLKQETKSIASVSFLKPFQNTVTEKKPPLGPSGVRMPLRRISNFLPSQIPPPHRNNNTNIPKSSSSYKIPPSRENKENFLGKMEPNSNRRSLLLQPRRCSIAVRPPPSSTTNFQPKRRVSIATYRPEPNPNTSSQMRRTSFMRDARKARYSRVFSPIRQVSLSEATPTAMRSSGSRFMGSPPPTQMGSWKPKLPTVIALQKKQVVWSPLKYRGLKSLKK